MKTAARARSVAFSFGIAAAVLSLLVVIGSYLRPVDTTDYFKQADEARPWISWGFDSAVVGLVFSLFGRKWWRAGAVAVSVLLLAFWVVQMGALL